MLLVLMLLEKAVHEPINKHVNFCNFSFTGAENFSTMHHRFSSEIPTTEDGDSQAPHSLHGFWDMIYGENERHNVECIFIEMETIADNIPIDKEVEPQLGPSTEKRSKASK